MVQLSLFNCERMVSNNSRVLGILLQGLYEKTAKNERWLSQNKQIKTAKLVMCRLKYIDLGLKALHKIFVPIVFLALKWKTADLDIERSLVQG